MNAELIYKEALQDIADKLNEYQNTAGTASPEDANTLLTRIAQRVNEAGKAFGAPEEVNREIRCD